MEKGSIQIYIEFEIKYIFLTQIYFCILEIFKTNVEFVF